MARDREGNMAERVVVRAGEGDCEVREREGKARRKVSVRVG